MLTGLLTAVCPDIEGKEHARAVLALVLAGVALLVGEVARPYRDPWVYWIYRVVSGPVLFVLDCLVACLGLSLLCQPLIGASNHGSELKTKSSSGTLLALAGYHLPRC